MSGPARLADRVALVTGAASGIGLAIAERFLDEGALVVAVDRDADRLALAAFPDQAVTCVADVTDPASVSSAVGSAVERFGRLDVVVNSAGIVRYSSLAELGVGEWREVQEVNVTGTFLVSQAAAGAMRAVPAGASNRSIINLASIEAIAVLARTGHPQVHYNASKGAVRMLTKALAVELGPDGIRVNSICPGVTETPLTRDGLAREGQREWLLERIPLRRLGQAADIAGAAAFLASDDAAYVTGADLVVDGGYLTQ
ncbi:MAG: SDR family NAD(P)-dependent oxidoreductase [Acidimicrobiales bacterium]